MAKTVKEIIIDYLEKNGYDGLCNDFGECGCLKDDLAPCECISTECKPGYKVKAPRGSDSDIEWMIVPESRTGFLKKGKDEIDK